VLVYLRNPALPGGHGVLVATDVPGRYAVGVGFDPDADTLAEFTERRWIELIRIATGVPDLAPTLVPFGQTTTEVHHWVADRFSDGRVHLVGDAVRVMPPTGAFGGNTAVLDGFYLAWKLAMVLRGQAGPGLLASHDPERRPYAEIIAEQQFAAYVQRSRPDLADPTVAAPVEPVSTLFFGYRHLSAAVCREPGDDGAPLENPERPTGRPGSRAPHVPLWRDGAELSTVDLFGRGFVLLTGSAEWVAAAADAGAALGVEVRAYRIGAEPGDGTFTDGGRWADTYGVTEAGAVLVRPDFFVAWRCVGAGDRTELERALCRVLAR
jgi:putative polyketide hydroxylase